MTATKRTSTITADLRAVLGAAHALMGAIEVALTVEPGRMTDDGLPENTHEIEAADDALLVAIENARVAGVTPGHVLAGKTYPPVGWDLTTEVNDDR